MTGPGDQFDGGADVTLETPPPLADGDILRLGEEHLAEVAETQRPHPSRAAPVRLVRARIAWWWLRRQLARAGVAAERIRRAGRSPRNILGRRIAWLRVVSWGRLLDLRVLAALAAAFLFVLDIVWVKLGVKLIWSADQVFNVVTTEGGKTVINTDAETILDTVSTVLATAFGAGAAGSFALLWREFFRCPSQARSLRRGIRRRPVTILPTAEVNGDAHALVRDNPLEGELIPRAELYDEVLPGVLRKYRRDVQIIVGDPGSGKTTALVAVAALLAKIGMVPVFVALRGRNPENIVGLAGEAFESHVRAHMRATTDCASLWRWLLDRRRVVVLIDDIEQIGRDGERGFVLRRTLDSLATRDFAVIVTARTAGIPAGVAASAVDLGALDEDSVVRYTVRVARDAAGAAPQPMSEMALRRWVREGKLAEVPFYLELLASLNAAGKCRELPSADVLHDEGEESGRFRPRADGHWEWNPNWVRFKLLELYFEWLEEGSVRRWLAIERRERRSTLELLENAALGHLLATARAATPEGLPDHAPKRLQDFIDPADRENVSLDGVRDRVSAHEAIDAGERLRILDRDQDLELQFRHRIMQAYMGARRLVRTTETRERLAKRVDTLLDRHNPEKLTAHMTLMFAALRAQDQGFRTGADGNGRGRGGSTESAREVRQIIVEQLINSARKAFEHEPPDARDPLRRDDIPDPDRRFNPDDALINLTTAAEIIHALRRDDRDGLFAGTAVAETEVLQTVGRGRRTTWVRLQQSQPTNRAPDGRWMHDTEAKIIDEVARARGATRWTKLNAIAAIAGLDDDTRWKRIWEFARDRDYTVRRAAANELQQSAKSAYRRLAPDIDRLILRASARTALNLPIDIKVLDQTGAPATDGAGLPALARAERIRPLDDWIREDVYDLRSLGWVLPAIVSGLREDPSAQRLLAHDEDAGGDTRHTADVHAARQALAAVVALAFEGGNHSFEASVAQGFKDDAMRHAEARDGRVSGPGWVASNQRLVADICLDHGEFWYARMLLHQALALYAIAGANRRETHTIITRLLNPSRERHPFVLQASKLARRAVERKQVHSDLWKGLIWDDESQAVSRRANLLDDKASQLVADVTLLLNLNEQSGEDRQIQFGHMHDLPHCLSLSRDRDEILGSGCPASCGWGLCPYEQPPPDEPNAQRGVSRAFCRQQQQIALRRRHLGWQRHIRRRSLERFWREMERQARS